MSYVVMFDYGRGLAHYICNHVWLWEKTNTLKCTYLGVFTWVGLIVFMRTNIRKMQIQC